MPSEVIIYLDHTLLHGSSNLPGAQRAASALLLGLASDGVYNALSVTSQAVSSYLAISPLPVKRAVYFLLHFPVSHLNRTLSGILPCEARTFLTWIYQERLPVLLAFGILSQERVNVKRWRISIYNEQEESI